MKNIKSAIIILAALAVIVVAWKAMSKPAAVQNAAGQEEVVSSEVIVEETIIPQEEQVNPAVQEAEQDAAKTNSMSDIQSLFSGCKEDADCIPVYPSCCKEAYAPYFVNKEYKDELIKEYKRVSGEPETCPEVSKCPRSYFGGAKAACVSGRCLQSIFDTPEFE